ncbi:hypothetical protein CJ030_MR5G006256 [Morella rubra]|uniref:Uncharacterized protein n=1 Tax=Morella rubra TaxID=262757 RepID=A0A6A1VI38_9ROSI|nr:hypothetical protein CJ030_MR5G006256 [Morella rubra]
MPKWETGFLLGAINLLVARAFNHKMPPTRGAIAKPSSKGDKGCDSRMWELEGGYPDLVSFPVDKKNGTMLLPTSLSILSIGHFPNLESLSSKGFESLTSLNQLKLSTCPKIISLPKEGLPPSLMQLDINGSTQSSTSPTEKTSSNMSAAKPGMDVGEIFLTAFLQVLFDRLASREFLSLVFREGIRKKLEKWRQTFSAIQLVLHDAERSKLRSGCENLA